MAKVLVSVGSKSWWGVLLCVWTLGCAAPLSEEECLELAPNQFCLTYVSDEACPDEWNGVEVDLEEGRVERADGSQAYCCQEISRECVPPRLVE